MASEEPNELPTHMQQVTSNGSMEALSDSDLETKSGSREEELEVTSQLLSTSELELEGGGDSAFCDSNLKDYITDLTLLSHAAVLGDDVTQTGKVHVYQHQPPGRLVDSSLVAEDSCTSTSYDKWKRLSGPMVLFLILGLIILIWGRSHLIQLVRWLERLPFLISMLVFILLFTIISFPFGFGYIILNMMAGYLYGIVRGQVIVMVSVSVGVSISFLLCRIWFKDYARSMVTSGSNALQAVLRVVEGPHGFKVIVLTRFTPIPFGLQNVLFAMTSVSYWQFFLASIFGLLPTQVLNTYMGSTVRSMQEVLTDRVDGYIILGIQVIFSIILMLYLLNKARRELAKLTHNVERQGEP